MLQSSIIYNIYHNQVAHSVIPRQNSSKNPHSPLPLLATSMVTSPILQIRILASTSANTTIVKKYFFFVRLQILLTEFSVGSKSNDEPQVALGISRSEGAFNLNEPQVTLESIMTWATSSNIGR